ncbi:MAG TPA: hypothetical protein VL137_01610 [Polyangiaceae bacterium]|nr:hypothetical protein [Polyangiaceae bacterium]
MLDRAYHRRSPRHWAALALVIPASLCSPSWADEPAAADAKTPQTASDLPAPPPIQTRYIQYGVALAANNIVNAGDVCPKNASAPCILGSGGGLAIRVGYRGPENWYFGGTYELSRLSSSNLLRLPILQQLRAETRFETTRRTRTVPYFAAGLGVAAYGNEWGADTAGFTAMAGAGLALQLSRASLVGVGLSYRPLLLRRWTDGAGQRRADGPGGFGLAHTITLEITFEIRSALSRW